MSWRLVSTVLWQVPGKSECWTLPESGAKFIACGVGLVVEQDTIHTRRWRTPECPRGKCLDSVWHPADQGFDCSVATVAHPAVESQRFGFGVQRPTEADALHTSGNDQAARQSRHAQVVWSRTGAIAARMPCISCRGVGGQPGMETSTGMTLATRPQEA